MLKKSSSPKDHCTLEWKGLNLYSRVWVLKIARFERSGYLGFLNILNIHQGSPWVAFLSSLGESDFLEICCFQVLGHQDSTTGASGG